MVEEQKVIGKLKGIEINEGTSNKGDWKRGALKIETTDGEIIASTFEKEDIKKAQELTGKKVKITYTQNGKYKNLTKNGICETDEDPTGTPITKEEIVGTPNNTGSNFEKRKQELIIRQSTWKMALKYLEALSLHGQKMEKDELLIDKIGKIAHLIEEDINR